MNKTYIPYFSVNRYLLQSIGLWPGEAKNLRRFQKSVVTIILLSSFYPQIGALIKYRQNYTTCCKIVMCIMISLICTIKYFNSAYETGHRMRRTLEWIHADWQTYKKKGEHEILCQRGRQGRMMSTIYLTIIYPALIAGALFPYVRYGYNCLTQENRTILLRTPMVLEYYVLDESKHMHWIMVHANIFYLVGAHAIIVTEVTSLMIAEHACALMELVRHCVDTAVEAAIEHPSRSAIRQYTKMIVHMHYRALSFIAFLNSSYMFHYSVILLIGVITLSLNIYILADSIVNMDDVDTLILSVVLIICHIAYMLFCTHAGQKIIDESTLIFTGTYCSRWYLTPLPMQKFLILFLERCLKISCFVSGGIVKPCFELLSSVLSTSMSYFMVLWSFS